MVTLTDEQRQLYENALLTGLSFEGAVLIAHIPQSKREALESDEEEMMNVRALQSSLELSLLNRMQTVSRKQARAGNEKATAWLLERLYSRYGKTPESEGGAIHLHIDSQRLEDMDTVDIVNDEAIRQLT